MSARLLLGCLLLLVADALLPAAAPATGRISGRVHGEDTRAPVPQTEVRLEGPTLARYENSNLVQKPRLQGRYQFNVPPGSYDLWVTAPGYEETKVRLEVTAGDSFERNFDLPPLLGVPYRIETLPLPRQMIGEVSGVAFTPRGTLVVTTRRGEVWQRRHPAGRWHRFAFGLYEGFGLVAPDEADVYVIQRPEITRVRDTDGDGEADVFTTVADDWGITGSYHEFSYGLARDSAGNFYAGSGMCSFRSAGELKWVRGPLRTEQYLPWTGTGPIPDGHRSVA